MIRCEVKPAQGGLQAELEERAEKVKPGWLARAATMTDRYRTAGLYSEPPDAIWSEIKDVFIEIQHCKCAFCERPLESKKEYDIEHFRPKSSVKPWKVPTELADAGIVVNQTTAKEAGYHLLPYHLLNYSVACARCNSDLKSDCFPIRGTRMPDGEDPAALQADEEAWLIYPIGDLDQDPEKLITFHGMSPQAAARKGSFGHQRALLTIAFFRLDDRNKRKELYRGRADVIQKMGFAFRELERPGTPASLKAQCQAIIDYHQSAGAAYTSCGRSFAKLWKDDRATAEQLWSDSVEFLATISPPRRRRRPA